MELTAAEGRVLGCLIAQQAVSPEPYALSLDEVRFACNQGYQQDRVAFDDRTVDDALVALKSKGLARFVQAGRNVGPVRYRHRADERWRLSPAELAVLSVLLLGGPQTVEEVQAAIRGVLGQDPASGIEVEVEIDVEAVLDALAGRTPEPFAIRVSPPTWGGNTLWAEVLTGQPSADDLYQTYERRPPPATLRRISPSTPGPAAGPDQPTLPGSTDATGPSTTSSPSSRSSASGRPTTLAELADRLTSIERRLAAIEAALAALRPGGRGADDDVYRPAPGPRPAGPRSGQGQGHESSRMIR